MAQDVKAIDFMDYVVTPEFIAKWNDAKKGELVCRMERAIGSLPSYRCLWGTNGLPWKESLEQMEQLGLKEGAKRKLLRDNTVQLFKL